MAATSALATVEKLAEHVAAQKDVNEAVMSEFFEAARLVAWKASWSVYGKVYELAVK